MSQTASAAPALRQAAPPQPPSRAAAGTPPAKAADALVAKVADRIARLADGNPLPRKDISFQGSRVDRKLTATLWVTLAFAPSTDKIRGATDPKGSARCPDEAAVSAGIEAARRAACADAALKESLAKGIRADPLRAFEKLGDEFAVTAPPVHLHRHIRCADCGASGQRKCGGLVCLGGTVPCGCLDGKNPCGRGCSSGLFHHNVQVWNPGLSRYEWESGLRRCGCDSGRTGTCYRCRGTTRVDCPHCRGSGYEDCGSCAATGWFTLATTARLVGRTSRKVTAREGAPPAFGQQVGRFHLPGVPAMCTEVLPGAVGVTDGGLVSTLACAMPHVEVTAGFGDIATERFDAFGTGAAIPGMPPFLERLLSELEFDIEIAIHKGDLAEAVRLARSSRLTLAALAAACTTGAGGADAIVRAYEGAASQEFASELVTKLCRTYDGIGRVAVRRTWLFLGFPVLAASAAISRALCDGTAGQARDWPEINPGVWNLAAIAAGLAPALLAAILAARRGRRSARAVVGEGARRSPRQGRWLAAGLGLSFLAALAGQQAAVPPAPSVAGMTQSRRAAVRSAPVTAAAVLSPSSLPTRTRPPPQPPARGTETVPRIQRGLSELGFYRGPVDGRMNRETGAAMGRMLALVPRDQGWRLGGLGEAGMVSAVLRDEIRLGRLPADGFVTRRLSNVSRTNLGRDDMARLRAAAVRAASRPGLEVPWASADGQRGGRVVAGRTGPGCLSFDVEVRLRGTVETTGPETACGPLSTTAWSQP